MTESGKTGLIDHDSRFDFLPRTQSYMNKLSNFDNQNQLDLSGMLLLAAFPKHSGELYKQSGALLELWPACGWLCVAVQLHGIQCV